MKNLKLLMMAGLFALAGNAQAQVKALTANDVAIKAGETAELVISLDYEVNAELCGTNFSVMLPDGIVLDGFDSKEEMLAGTKKKLSKAAEIDEENNPWGEDFGNDMIYDFKGKADGGLLLILMDSDKSPFITKKCKLITLTLKALEDVVDEGKIYLIGFTDTNNVSVGLGTIDDFVFGINKEAVGINDIKTTETTAPAYNLQGIRVNNAKGLIIRDGKKMVVK
jgi:hypothetical protein